MGIAKGFVFNFNLVLEVTLQLYLGLGRELCNAILRLEPHLRNVAQLLMTRRRQTEEILETVLHRRIALEEVVKSFRQTRHTIPVVHLYE